MNAPTADPLQRCRTGDIARPYRRRHTGPWRQRFCNRRAPSRRGHWQEAGADLLARGPGTSTVMSLAADVTPRNAHEARMKEKILKLLQRGKVLGTTLDWEVAISTNLALLGQPAGGQPAGFEALLKAAREGKRRRVRALLNAGVDPNAHDTYGLTAAHHAAGAGFKNILRELAAHGADAGGIWTESLERPSAFAGDCRPLAGADQFADEFAGEPAGVMGNSPELAFSI